MNGPQIPQKTRLKFTAMVATYVGSSLNDNFYRQCIMLLVVAAGMDKFQGYGTLLFTLPFVLFSAYAGFLADRFPKRSVIITARLLALAAYIVGAVGLYFFSVPITLVVLFILGLQSTIFSPSINGTIPELYPPEYVVTANAVMRIVATGAILLGIAGSGFVLDIEGTFGNVPLGRAVAAAVAVAIAFLALITSSFIPRFPAACSTVRFPWAGPLVSIKTLMHTRRDPLLAISIFAKAFFWFSGSLQILIINKLGLTQFNLTNSLTSGLVVVELVGIAVGSMVCPRLVRGARWYRVLTPAVFVMALSMFAVAAVPYMPAVTRRPFIIAALATLGISGGIFSVPLASFVQTRPSPDHKGRLIAASVFADFTGILTSGAVFYIFAEAAIAPSNCFAIEGAMILAVAVWLYLVLPKVPDND